MKGYQLEYLLAVAETRNFTNAANYMNITQPTLSKAISSLDLFICNRGSLILTDSGVKFLSQAKNVVHEMQERLDFAAIGQLIRLARLGIGFLSVRPRFCYPFFSPKPHGLNLGSR